MLLFWQQLPLRSYGGPPCKHLINRLNRKIPEVLVPCQERETKRDLSPLVIAACLPDAQPYSVAFLTNQTLGLE